jgi:hypothetical protein
VPQQYRGKEIITVCENITFCEKMMYRNRTSAWVVEAIAVGFLLTLFNFSILSSGFSVEKLLLIWILTFGAGLLLIYRLFYHIDTLILERIQQLTRDTQIGGRKNTTPLTEDLNQRKPVPELQPQLDDGELVKAENGVYKCDECLKSYHGYEKAKKHQEQRGHSVSLAWRK